MVSQFISVVAGQQLATVGVKLAGTNMLRVLVRVSVAPQWRVGEAQTPEVSAPLSENQLQWGPGEVGEQNVTLDLSACSELLSAGTLRVFLSEAVNADLDESRDSSLVSALPADSFRVRFSSEPNQVGCMVV